MSCPTRWSGHAKREEIADAAAVGAAEALLGGGGQWSRPRPAEEVRIKLSELCYKSIAADATEDKKHIDLSSEPLILVCAAGLRGSTADDVAKEIAIFRAHKATPIVIADEGDQRYTRRRHHRAAGRPGARVRAVGDGRAPVRVRGGACHRRLGAPVARGEAAIERAVADTRDGDAVLAVLRTQIPPYAHRFLDGLRDHI